MLTGTSNRTVASTNMNATSSRAHTVMTITFDQIIRNEMGSETKKSSVMNLVDLAGESVSVDRQNHVNLAGENVKAGRTLWTWQVTM